MVHRSVAPPRRPGRPTGPRKIKIGARVLPATASALRFHAFTADKSLGEYLDTVIEGRGLQAHVETPLDATTGVPEPHNHNATYTRTNSGPEDKKTPQLNKEVPRKPKDDQGHRQAPWTSHR